MKKMNESEWIEIGNQVKKTREELFKIFNMISGKLPKQTVDELSLSIDKLDAFRSDAEDIMIDQGASESTHVFYGERGNKQ